MEQLIVKILTLPHLRNKWQGCDIIVCGLGTSLNDLKNPEKYLTIGVNDIGGKFAPDLVVCIDPLTRFKIGNRKNDILNAKSRYFCSQLDPKAYPGLQAENYVRFRLGKRMGVGFQFSEMSDRLDYHNTSPYVAANLAAYVGAKRIFLIGVDLTPNHYNRQSGVHALAKRLKEIDTQYDKFSKECSKNGVSIFNLSKSSKLTSLKKVEISEVHLKEACSEKDIIPPKPDPKPKVSRTKRKPNPAPISNPPGTNRRANKRSQRNKRAGNISTTTRRNG